ncbi:MAG TPA: tRNA lysidine(34) synthetase TilS [Sphingobacteriaceae bacterium]
MLPVDRLYDFIRLKSLFQPTEKVLLAVSGGRDSVLMAHLFKEAGFLFGIAHCNFMLRGEEADADEVFTERLADTFGVPFHSTRFNTAAYASDNAMSIQMAARELRYQWFEEIRVGHGYACIATAHHQNDTVESVLLNLVRGTGIAGLHGILPKRGNIIRPLLFLTRDEIDRLVSTESIAYRDDASNLSTRYARNKIRLEVIPKLKELNPNLEATFEANSRRFAELEMLMNEKVAEARALLLEERDDTIYISIDKVEELKPLHTLLFEILKPFSFTEPVLRDLIRSLQGQPGLTFESETHVLVIDRGKLIISPRFSSRQTSVSVRQEDDEVSWGEHQFSVSRDEATGFSIRNNRFVAQFDLDLLVFPLVLRSWKPGDLFMPLGLRGKKKVSDLFIDQKVALPAKSKTPILENGNGDIIWVAGLRIDDRYKVTSDTKKVYIFELKNNGE